jgi:hypothetical protein
MDELVQTDPLSSKHLLRAALHLQEFYSGSRDRAVLRRRGAHFLIGQARDITADLSPLIDSLQSRSHKLGHLARLSLTHNSNKSQSFESDQSSVHNPKEITADLHPVLPSILDAMEETAAFADIYRNLTKRIDRLHEWGDALLWELSIDIERWDMLCSAQMNAVTRLASLLGEDVSDDWYEPSLARAGVVAAVLDPECSSVYRELLSNIPAGDEADDSSFYDSE